VTHILACRLGLITGLCRSSKDRATILFCSEEIKTRHGHDYLDSVKVLNIFKIREDALSK
jgi:hypothetical protein